MDNKSKPPVFYLPLSQTTYQKYLIDILIQLHKPHILSYLNNNKHFDNNKTPKSESQNSEDGTMSDTSMFDAFIFNIKQITNHPTLLVDHYIPPNLLLLNSKESIIRLSNKYHHISAILDKLVEKDVRKTIVINVSNAKEMDLIESFLLGKTGLQYYRFSGSSLYYDNHGLFDFHKDNSFDNTDSSGNSTPTPSDIFVNGTKKKSSGRTKKISNINTVLSNRNGNEDNGFGLASSSTINSSTVSSSSSDKDKKRKKKGGRPSSAEKRAREQQVQSHQSNDSDPGQNHKGRGDKEEYIPRLSKNNEEFCNKLIEKKSKKLNVYLILSSQLKYLLQFEDLKSDMILSLDSNFTDFEDISVVLNHQVPILKPIVLESLEHYECELKNDPDLTFNVNSARNKPRRSKNSSTCKMSNTNTSYSLDTAAQEKVEKSQFNRLLCLLTVASWSNVQLQVPSGNQPVSDRLIEWLVDPVKNQFPYSSTIDTELPHVMNDDLIEQVKKTLNISYDLSNILGVEELDKYKFFNSKLEDDANLHVEDFNDVDMKTEENNNVDLAQTVDKKEHTVKRAKHNPGTLIDSIPETFTYRLYQSHLTKLITKTLHAMILWISKNKKVLEFVHLDETERQHVIDQGNLECGELFKKDRDLGVKIEARSKIKDRMLNEYEKLQKTNDDFKERYDSYSSLSLDSLNMTAKDDEIEILKEKLNKLQISLSESNKNSDLIRQKYQENSSRAAELSAFLKTLENTGKKLENDSQGMFKKIQIQGVIEKQRYVSSRVNELKNTYQMWSSYLKVLQSELEKRSGNNVGSSINTNNSSGYANSSSNSGSTSHGRSSRSSRNNTPY